MCCAYAYLTPGCELVQCVRVGGQLQSQVVVVIEGVGGAVVHTAAHVPPVAHGVRRRLAVVNLFAQILVQFEAQKPTFTAALLGLGNVELKHRAVQRHPLREAKHCLKRITEYEIVDETQTKINENTEARKFTFSV